MRELFLVILICDGSTPLESQHSTAIGKSKTRHIRFCVKVPLVSSSEKCNCSVVQVGAVQCSAMATWPQVQSLESPVETSQDPSPKPLLNSNLTVNPLKLLTMISSARQTDL